MFNLFKKPKVDANEGNDAPKKPKEDVKQDSFQFKFPEDQEIEIYKRVAKTYSRFLNQPIDPAKKQLIESNQRRSLSTEEMKMLLVAEKSNKNRRGLKDWLDFGIKSGKLPGMFFLDYQGKMSCYKSALQKYVRRGMTEKALEAGLVLFKMGRDQAVRRLKIIVIEDVFTAVEVMRYLQKDMSVNEFLSVVKFISEAPKDKSGCEVADYLMSRNLDELTVDEKLLKENVKKKEHFIQLCTMVLKLAKEKEWAVLKRCLGNDSVVESCLQRFAEGTFFQGDSGLMIVAVVRYLSGDYLLKRITLPNVSADDIPVLKLAEIDWFALDFHTPIGRAVKYAFLKKFPEIEEQQLDNAWFRCESAKLAENQIGQWEPEGMALSQRTWRKYKDEIETMVKDFQFNKFRVQDYDK